MWQNRTQNHYWKVSLCKSESHGSGRNDLVLRAISNLLRILITECGYNHITPQRYLRHIIHNQTVVEHAVLCRSNCPEMFFKKVVLKNFTKFTGQHLYQSLFFSKVAGLTKELWHRCFLVNFAKILITPLLQNTSGGCSILTVEWKLTQQTFVLVKTSSV